MNIKQAQPIFFTENGENTKVKLFGELSDAMLKTAPMIGSCFLFNEWEHELGIMCYAPDPPIVV